MKFVYCDKCENLVGKVFDSGAPLTCCEQKMEELTVNTKEAAHEKHIPVLVGEGNSFIVEVGSVAHPMEEAHYIAWIYVETEQGGQRKSLSPGEAPKACFNLCKDKVTAVYAYCNLHGLWKADL